MSKTAGKDRIKDFIQKYNITCDRLAVWIIVVMMFMALSLTKIFAGFIPIFNYSYNPPALCGLYVVMIVAVYALVFVPRVCTNDGGLKAYLSKYRVLVCILAVLLLAIITTDIITLAKGQLRITNILTHNLDYLYAFLALPITVLLVEEKWRWDDFANAILTLSVASMVLRSFVSIYFGLTGIEITAISKESAIESWFREDRLRVTAPCFVLQIVPIAMYMFMVTKNYIKKIMYVAVIVITLVFSYYTWQSRLGILIILGGAFAMIMFWNTSKKITYIKWGLVAAAIIVFIAAGGIGILTRLLSPTDGVTAYSAENRGHYMAYSLFIGMFLKEPFGSGLTEDLAVWYPNGRALWMCDAGIMYSLVPMGVLILVFFLIIFARGIYVYIKKRKVSDIATLALSLTLILVAMECSMDCFFTPIAFMVGFMLAIIEYAALRNDEPGEVDEGR